MFQNIRLFLGIFSFFSNKILISVFEKKPLIFCTCNAGFILSSRVLIKTFRVQWMRRGSVNVDIHIFVRELWDKVERYNSRVTRQSRAYHWTYKIYLRTEWECTHSNFNNKVRHSSPLIWYDLPTCFWELRDEIRTSRKCIVGYRRLARSLRNMFATQKHARNGLNVCRDLFTLLWSLHKTDFSCLALRTVSC